MMIDSSPYVGSCYQTQRVPPWPLYRVSRGDGVPVSHTNDTEDDTQVGDRGPQLMAPSHQSSVGKHTGEVKAFLFLR